MKFEKWQALGNDYIILEAGSLVFDLTPPRIRRICASHVGIGSDGILLLHHSDEPGFVASLQIFNPDGSEAELSGNGAREAFLYLSRNGWTREREFSIKTAAGAVRATLTTPTTCVVEMAPARLSGPAFPSGGSDGRGVVHSGGRDWRFQHSDVGNPQCAIAMASETELAALELADIGPAIEHSPLFPNRTNVSWYTVTGPARIRARIFERGVGETSASGTGAIGAAVAYVLSGGQSPVSVELDGGELTVEVDKNLQITLTGWAAPVFSGSFSDEFLEELRET
ncbi:MAG: diaminopimelate epimerase [Solirubrobacteraceae bacterium]